MKEMICYGFDNLGQKSEPFSADHRLVLVSNFVGGNILDFSNRVSVSAENGATEKKSETETSRNRLFSLSRRRQLSSRLVVISPPPKLKLKVHFFVE